MARKYKLITLEDRRKIERAYYNGAAPGAIAAEVGASLSSIYREIARGYTGRTDKTGVRRIAPTSPKRTPPKG